MPSNNKKDSTAFDEKIRRYLGWEKQKHMKTCYIAAPFVIGNEGTLKNDFRTVALGSEKSLLRRTKEELTICFDGRDYHYIGPYWYEEGEDGTFTDCDSATVVSRERKMIDEADLILTVFDGNPAPGTVSELIYAACTGKETEVIYLKTDTKECDIPSPYWYPITLASQLSKKVHIRSVDSLDEIRFLFLRK